MKNTLYLKMRYHYLQADLKRVKGAYEGAREEIAVSINALEKIDRTLFTHHEILIRKFSVLTISGRIYEEQGEFEKALQIYNQLLTLIDAEENIDKWYRYYTHGVKNWVLVQLQNFSEAEEFSLKLIANVELEEIQSPALANAILRTFTTLISIYMKKGELEKADEYAKTALMLAKKGGNPRLIGISENNIAALRTMTGKWTDAAHAFEKGLRQATRYNNKFDMAVSHLNLAECYHNLGDSKRATENLMLGKKLTETYSLGLKESLQQLEKIIDMP
jgi:tetratricopeptide (TPR) repeat protein